MFMSCCGLAVVLALGAGLILFAVLVLVLVVVVLVGVGPVAEFERIEQIVQRVGELALVLDHAFEAIEPRARLVLDERPPQIDQLLRRLRRGMPGQPLAHHHGQRIGQWRIGTVGDLVEFAAMEMVVEHRGEIFRDARHAPRADRLDPRLLDRIEHAARLHVAGHLLAMHGGIMAGEAQRDRVRHDRVRLPHPSSTVCAAARAAAPCRARGPGRSAANVTSSSGCLAIARRHDVTARLNGSVGASFDPGLNFEFVVIRSLLSSLRAGSQQPGCQSGRRSPA